MNFVSEPVVQVKGVDILQDGQTVLDDVNFEIEKGEFLYLIGRTGSGKTSLLKTLYADLHPSSGFISVAGFDIRYLKPSKVPYLRRKIGIIFQDFQLLEDRNVSENLVFVMRATGWKENSKIQARLTDVLMQVGLGSALDKMPHQLSGGEQQRVVIARALLNEPVMLLADEPTGNLDPEVSEGIFQLFLEINKSGTAILMGTHDHSLMNNHPARILKCEKTKLLDSKVDTFELSSF